MQIIKQSGTSTATQAPHLYFINGTVDFLLIGGLSILLFLVILPAKNIERSSTVIQIAAFLLWMGNWPHFAATNYRLYHARENMAQYPLTAFVVPVLLVAAVIACFTSPERIAPYFIKLFLIWSPYHYSGQAMGITLIYARRAGFVVGKAERLALSGFIFGTFVLQIVLSEVSGVRRSFYDINYPSLGLSPIVGTIIAAVMWTCGVVFLIFVVRWCLISKKILPPIILLPAITQFVWFILGSQIPMYYEFVPFFHGIQYLLIAWAMQLKEKMDLNGIRPSPVYVMKETMQWYAGIFVMGIVLFWVMPRIGTKFGYDLQFAEPVIISAIQIHHFFVDGVIWKLRNPKVGSPLLVNIEQLVKISPAVPASTPPRLQTT